MNLWRALIVLCTAAAPALAFCATAIRSGAGRHRITGACLGDAYALRAGVQNDEHRSW
jgi:hypothetical protein